MKVELTPDMTVFAEACVAEGRYADLAEVVSSALRLLRDQEARKRDFMAMLAKVEAEVDRGEVFTLDEVMADMDAIIEAAEAHAAE